MSWLELDNRILEHPKFIRAVNLGGSEAIHLWLGLRAYCGQLLTDGAIPKDMLTEVRGPANAKKRALALDALVKIGLIEDCGDSYRMHDYLQWADSREEILKRRAVGSSRSAMRANAELMKAVKSRDGSACRYCGINVDWANHRGASGGTYDHVIPLSKRGNNDLDNIVVSCRACNSRKRDREPWECGMKLLPVPDTESLPVGNSVPTNSTPNGEVWCGLDPVFSPLADQKTPQVDPSRPAPRDPKALAKFYRSDPVRAHAELGSVETWPEVKAVCAAFERTW